jgi:uncharacterized protein with PQ loop repeat
MADLLSVIGYIGTGIVIGAYAPQISHLWTEHCSAGISERAYVLWALASALFLGHSIVIGDTVFMVTQLVNVVALAIIVVLARRSVTRSAPCMRASFTYESSSVRG